MKPSSYWGYPHDELETPMFSSPEDRASLQTCCICNNFSQIQPEIKICGAKNERNARNEEGPQKNQRFL